MQEVFPNYYHKFKCISEKCTHNCCIGWEINIDDETMQLYEALDTDMGKRIRENIGGVNPHFVLSEDDRCPFLNETGLCDIISEYGEDAICDICYLHPRFKNFYSSFEEVGLGLSCEEAVRVVLGESEPFTIDTPENIDANEELFFAKRKEILCVLQNRNKSIGERFKQLAEMFGLEFNFPMSYLSEIYMSLERLDDEWTKKIENLNSVNFDSQIFENEEYQILFEQLAVYFIFRHLTKALYDGDYKSKVRFALMSCYLIGAVCSLNKCRNIENIFDIVRMYSAEIEYSEENTDILLHKG